MDQEITISENSESDIHQSENDMCILSYNGQQRSGVTATDEGLKSQLAGAISILLAISALITVSVFTLTAIISNEPNSKIDSDIIIKYLYRSGSVFLALVLLLMTAQLGIFNRKNAPFFVTDVAYNKFLLYIMLFLFMPATEIYLVFRFVVDVFLAHCIDSGYPIEAFIQVVFIAAVGLYTVKMCKRRVIGPEHLVISVKVTIAAVVVTCISIWTYRVHINAGKRFAYYWLAQKKLSECSVSNTTLTFFLHFENYTSPFLLQLCITCSALLYGPFSKSVVGVPHSHELNEPVATRRQFQCQPIPVVLGISIFLFCTVSVVYDGLEGSKSIFTDMLISSTTEYFALLVCLIANCLLFYQIIHYKPCRVENHADRTLLWLSTAGTIIYSMFNCHGNALLLTRNATALGLPNLTSSEVALDGTYGILLFLQSMSQAVVLDVSLCRKGGTLPPIIRKCQPALILLFANIGFWVYTIYAGISNLSKYSDNIYMKVYGEYVWYVVVSICVPLFSLHKLQCASILYKIHRDSG